MRIGSITLAAGIALAYAQPAASQALTPPLPANAFITVGSLDWAWASACTFNIPGSCVSEFVIVDGFRFATADEWAARPDPSAFLDPGGNYFGSGGMMRCAEFYFDVSPQWGQCDYADAVGGYVTSGPDNLGTAQHPNAETWLVRGAGDGGGGGGGESVVPEPSTYLLLGSGLAMLGLAGRMRRRMRSESAG